MPNQWLIDSLQRVEIFNRTINEAQKALNDVTKGRDAVQQDLYAYWRATALKSFECIKGLPGVLPTDRSDTYVKFTLAERNWLFVMPQKLDENEAYHGFYNLHPNPKNGAGDGHSKWRWDSDPDFVLAEVTRRMKDEHQAWTERVKKEEEEDARIYE